MSTDNVQIHEPLTVGDMMRAAEAIAAALDTLDTDTLAQMQSGDANVAQVGQQVVAVALRIAPEQGQRFLSGLVDMDPDEFQQLPADAVLDIVEALSEREDVLRFFRRARSMAGNFMTSAPAEGAS